MKSHFLPFMTRMRMLRRDRGGVAAVEFALLLPLLLVMLGGSVEMGRMLISYRQFEATVIGMSRHVARYPEYERRAREYAQPMPKELFPSADLANINIIVNSLTKDKGGTTMIEAFPGHVLYGSNPGLDWRDSVNPAAFGDNEVVIFVGATYEYRSLMPFLSAASITFSKEVQILPSFGRTFNWVDGQVDDSLYVY